MFGKRNVSVVFRVILLAIAMNAAAARLAVAQLPTATISGVVKDATGAVIPDVDLTVTNTETGITRSGATSGNGSYRFPALPVGKYDVKAEHPGFQGKVQQGLQLTVGQEAVLPFTLDVGAVTESVSVTAEAPIVNTTSGSLGNLVSSQTLADLPLNGRNWNDLTLLQTGVSESRNTDTSGVLNGTPMTVNGAPIRSNLFTLDGTIMNDTNGIGAASANENTVGADGIREYKVVTNAFSAEYGMSMGSQVQLVTKSGTNQLHGTLFEYIRNSAINAHGWANKAPEKRNNFGGSIGGPIKKDKLFFFATYEGIRQTAQGANQNSTVPDPAFVATKTVAASVKPYLQYWPAPNAIATSAQAALGIGVFNYAVTNRNNEDYGQGRVDYNLTSKDQLFGRYTIDNSLQSVPTWLPQDASQYPFKSTGFVVPEVTQSDPDRNQYFTLSDNHIFTPSLLSTMRGSFSRTHYVAVLGQNFPANLAFSPASVMLGGLGVSGVTDYATALGGPTSTEQNQRIISYSNDIFYTPGGRHSLKFGALINAYRQLVWNNGGNNPYGSWGFASLTDFLNANPNSYSVQTPGSVADRTFDYKTFGFYVQDDFRVTSRVVLNLGLRYEFTNQITEARGKGSAVQDIAHDGKATCSDAAQIAIGNANPGNNLGCLAGDDIPFINPSKKAISPRFGLAWDVRGDGKTSVRMGIAKLYDISSMGTSLFIFSSGTPPYITLSQATTANKQVVPAFGPLPPIPSGFGATRLRTIDFHLKQPALYSYNVTVERQLPAGMGLTVAYAGSRGEHLVQNKEGNPFFAQGTPVGGTCVNTGTAPANDAPKCFLGTEVRRNQNWGTVEYRPADGDSWYNALQVSLQKRLGQNVQFQSSYTYAKTQDETQGQLGFDTSGGGGGGVGDPTNRKYDKSAGNFDLRHNWKFNSVYRVPSNFNGIVGKFANGWRLSGILTMRSGDPFTIIGNLAQRAGGNGNTRLDLAPGAKVNDLTTGTSMGCSGVYNVAVGTKLGTQALFFDPCAFQLPAPGFLGNTGRNILYGPSFFNLDFSLVKDTKLPKLGEGGALEFRAEFFNILNHASWGLPGATLFNITGANSANGTGAAFNPGTNVKVAAAGNGGSIPAQTEASRPRKLQFSLRVSF
jgi:carboxypeptidase family protein/TonB-dependent receptor-like protein